jgi:hypothetical protein
MGTVRSWGLVGILLALGAAGLARAAQQPSFTYAPYADVLKTYVDDAGLVDYKGLKAHREELDRFARELADLDPVVYEKWTDKEKVAFWINAYNALTLQVIIDHYPIKAGFFGSFVYPKNSIRQISGVWDEITFPVMGKPTTLEGIEHGTLRKKFSEPRIHLALVCAAMGCPKLRNEPYVAEKLDEQFADQTRIFVATHSKFRINQDRGQVHISPIFKWFGEDFVDKYGTSMKYSGFDAPERAVLNYVSKYLSQQDRQYLEQGDYQIKYLDYDWSLNEQTPKS